MNDHQDLPDSKVSPELPGDQVDWSLVPRVSDEEYARRLSALSAEAAGPLRADISRYLTDRLEVLKATFHIQPCKVGREEEWEAPTECVCGLTDERERVRVLLAHHEGRAQEGT